MGLDWGGLVNCGDSARPIYPILAGLRLLAKKKENLPP
jgi:hypothetical protein